MLVTAGLANACGPMGLRINAVNPAGTRTERLKAGIAAQVRLQSVSEEAALVPRPVTIALRRVVQVVGWPGAGA